ncbi:hypothetical protein HD554DRAFT_2316625 [Boletus coccyginus]|nr:hypothetical protein HD554DRAFT_2316625 [Boletus coccyginus]
MLAASTTELERQGCDVLRHCLGDDPPPIGTAGVEDVFWMSSAKSTPQADACSEGLIKLVQPAVIAPMSGNNGHGKFQVEIQIRLGFQMRMRTSSGNAVSGFVRVHGCVIKLRHVTGGGERTTFRAPSHYLDNTLRLQQIQHTEVEKVDNSPRSLAQTIQELRNELAESQQTHQEMDYPIQSLRAEEESSSSNNACLEKTIQELCDKLAECQHAANQPKNRLSESSSSKITHLGQTIQELRVQLAEAQRINHAHEQKHQCESLYAQGRIQGVAECLLEFANIV